MRVTVPEARLVNPTPSDPSTMAEATLYPRVIPAAKVVVAVTTFNGKHLLERSLPSVTEQETNHEIVPVLVDNLSSDGSAEFGERVGFKVLRPRKPESVYDAWNRAVRYADRVKADYVLICNDDVVLPKNYAESLVWAYESAVYSPGMVTGVPWVPGVGWQEFWWRHAMKEAKPTFLDWHPAGATSAFMVRMDVFRSIGLFNTFEGVYCGDNDFHERLLRSGYKPLVVPIPFVHYAGVTAQAKPDAFEKFLRSMTAYAEKWGALARGHDFYKDRLPEHLRGLRDSGEAYRGYCKAEEAYLRKPKGPKVAIMMRGGLGDCIMAIPVVEYWKQQGFWVDVWTSPIGRSAFMLSNADRIMSWQLGSERADEFWGTGWANALTIAKKWKYEEIVRCSILPEHSALWDEARLGINVLIQRLGGVPDPPSWDGFFVPHWGSRCLLIPPKTAPRRVVFAPHGHSAAVDWDYDALDDLFCRLSKDFGCEVVHVSTKPYQGQFGVVQTGMLPDPALQIAEICRDADVYFGISTAPLWICAFMGKPCVQVLPNDPKDWRRLHHEACGFEGVSVHYGSKGDVELLYDAIGQYLEE